MKGGVELNDQTSKVQTLDPSPSPPDEKVDNDNGKDDTDAAAPIVSQARAHIIAATAENEQ